jgi:hypothetical protein
MKTAFVLALAVTTITLVSTAHAADGPVVPLTLTCAAYTKDLAVKTEFSTELSLQVSAQTGKKFLSFRSPEAFKTIDGRYKIGLAAVQPFNDSLVPRRRMSIWVTDLFNAGPTLQTGGILADVSNNEQDHASLSIIDRTQNNGFELMIDVN